MAERHNFFKNGVLSLPPGFRFHPTDEELVMHYLRRKVFSCSMPASIIPDVEVCKSDPWDLPGDAEQERYFFSTREAKYPSGNRANRATVSGYWKATGIDRQIVTSRGNAVVGLKKTLVFYIGKPPTGTKTDWIMHEYRLASPHATAPAPPRNDHLKMKLNKSPPAVRPVGNWVLCRIFLKKRSSKNDDGDKTGDSPCKEFQIQRSDNVNNSPVFYEFLTTDKKSPTDLNVVPSSSSSGSSGITRVSADRNNNISDDNEENSSSNSFSFTNLAE